jgi:hypothetical protein
MHPMHVKSTWYVQTDVSPSDNVLAQSEFGRLILIVGARRKKKMEKTCTLQHYVRTCCCGLVLRTYVRDHSICWTTGSPTHAFIGRYYYKFVNKPIEFVCFSLAGEGVMIMPRCNDCVLKKIKR